MTYAFPPGLRKLVRKKMASGKYDSEDQLLLSAVQALDAVEARHEALRSEIQVRVKKAGRGKSRPLNRTAFKSEARRRLREKG